MVKGKTQCNKLSYLYFVYGIVMLTANMELNPCQLIAKVPHATLFVCIDGLMVACSPITQAAGVRLLGDADICSSDSCLKWRFRVLCRVLSARNTS